MLYVVTFTINIPPMLAYIPYMDPMGKTSSVQACCSQVFLDQYGMWTWDVDRIKQMPVHQFQMIQVGVHTRKKENPLYLVLSYSTICSYYSETISENWLNGGCFQLFVIVDLELTGLFKHFMCYINEDLI